MEEQIPGGNQNKKSKGNGLVVCGRRCGWCERDVFVARKGWRGVGLLGVSGFLRLRCAEDYSVYGWGGVGMGGGGRAVARYPLITVRLS